jgi:CBS-domain-containing membrane protein
MGAEQAPSATVTERDITRRAAFGLDGDTSAAEEYLYYAIARIRRLGLRHMPVVDEQGRLQGILNLPGAGRSTKRERRDTDRFKRRGGAGGLTGTEMRVD